ncbi:hypothetical protein [Antarctobacter sp.]|uniref:hypothetical protein n=1 Tax=Antarctobacter sp. TaxID=1872577 RepID=UPI003A90798D
MREQRAWDELLNAWGADEGAGAEERQWNWLLPRSASGQGSRRNARAATKRPGRLDPGHLGRECQRDLTAKKAVISSSTSTAEATAPRVTHAAGCGWRPEQLRAPGRRAGHAWPA